MFNPVVRHFRIHFFSPRPCFNFSTGASLSDFAKSFMMPEQYYKTDPGPQQQSKDKPDTGQPQIEFSLHRLGRRCKYDREADTQARAHKFWSAYMSKVAADEYRGPWLGLAPLRAAFKDKPEQRLLRLKQDSIELALQSPAPQSQGPHPPLKLRAFPKLYVCPIGWAVGIVVDVEGDLKFENLAPLVDVLRTVPAFVYRQQPAPLRLEQVLTAMHRMVRNALLAPDNHRPANETAKSYIVCSLVNFQEQATFVGDEKVDMSIVLRILEQGPALSDETKRTVSPAPRSLTITRFNRGTMRITASLGETDRQSPECALSNLKNCLLMTALMEQFHSDASGHSSPAVQKMREEVELTFMQLKSIWKSPHFHALCNQDAGLQKMKKAAVENVFNFIQSTFKDVAIGDKATVIQNLDPGRRTVYLSAPEKMNEIGKPASPGQ